MKLLNKIVLVSILLVSYIWLSLAFDIPENDGYVTDHAGIFSSWQEQKLESLILEINKESNVEIAIISVGSVWLEDVNMVAAEIGNERGVGKEEVDNGVVMLLAIDDRRWGIQVWYWLEWTLPDAIVKRVWERHFPQNFRQWNYYQWVALAVADMYSYIKEDPEVMSYYNNNTDSNKSNDESFIPIFIFFGLIFAFILKWIKKKYKDDKIKYWIGFLILGGILWLIVFAIISQIIISLIIWYVWLLFGTLFVGARGMMYGPMMGRWWFGWTMWGFGWGWFGGFGWWSFGGGWAWWSW